MTFLTNYGIHLSMKTTSFFAIIVATAYCLPTEIHAAEFQWKETAPGQLDLLYGDAPVIRYMHAFDQSTKESSHDTYKVFHHVFGPSSGKVITKGPGGKYTHHRGLYVGWNRTQTPDGGFDFWHCSKGAHLRHAKLVSSAGGKDSGSMVAEIHWNDSSGEPVIVETRKVTVSAVELKSGLSWVIDWTTRLESKRGAIELRGDRQHAGFQFRAAQPVADANAARYVRPKGFPEQPEAFQVGDKGNPPAHINLKWLCMTYPLDGSQYNIEYMEAPGQPEPSLYSERPYGRFGAFFKADLTESSPLQMTYRVIVSEGATPTRQEIQDRYDGWVTSIR